MNSQEVRSTGAPTPPTSLAMCVFIDAFGWELASRIPFLDDLLVQKIPLQTVFGYSSTCDPTILTGCLPREHGHFAFYAYDPGRSPFRHYRALRFLPASLVNRGRVRAKLSQIFKMAHGFTGYFQLYNMPFEQLHLFNYMERRNIFEPGGINGGQPTIFDYLRNNRIPYCRPESYDEASTFNEANEAIKHRSIAFAYLFLGKLDGILHARGTTANAVRDHVAWYEGQIRRVYENAVKNYQHVQLCVFSDHGMTDIKRTCDLMARIQSTGLRFGADYAAVYDSTMARFWFLQEGARDTVIGALQQESSGHILSDAELASYGCDFPGHTYGELFFLMDPGVLICPSHMGIKPLAGMHGYAPDHKDSVAAFMSNSQVSPAPKHLCDLYAVMRRALPRARTED